MSTNRKFIGIAVWGLVGAATVSGVVAYKTVFSRPGAESLFMLPTSAVAVGILDFNPSPAQALAYKKIDEALNRNSLGKKLDTGFYEMTTSGFTDVDVLKPYILRGAVAAMLSEGDREGGVMVLPLSDGPAVEKLLKAQGKPKFYKGTKYYGLKLGNMKNGPVEAGYVVEGNYLIAASDGWIFAPVLAAARGTAPRLVDDVAFQAARSRAIGDSNLTCLISPRLMEASFLKDEKGESRSKDVPYKGWMSMSAAIRDGGLEVAFDGQVDEKVSPALASLGKIPDLKKAVMSALPENPYMLIAMAAPGEFADAGMDEVKKQFKEEDMTKGLLEETGLDMDQDLIPALKGTMVMGIYPNGTDKAEGLDLVAVLGSDSGATPAKAADKIFAHVKSEVEKEGGEYPFVTTEQGDVKITTFNEKQNAELNKSFGESWAKSTGKNSLGEKTFIMATIGEACIVASSRSMLDRAIASYRANDSKLGTTGSFALANKEVEQGTQMLLALDLKTVTDGARNSFDTKGWNDEDKQLFGDMIGIFGSLAEPLTVTMKVSGDRLTSRTFIPLEWDKGIDLLGKEINSPEPKG